MKNTFLFLKSILLISLTSIMLSSCISDEPDYKLDVDPTDIVVGFEKDREYPINILANCDWEVVSIPDFLDVTVIEGMGDEEIGLITNRSNYTTEPRQGEIVIQSGDKSVTINVTQENGLASNCNVYHINILEMYNSVAWNYEYEDDVAYFYRYAMETEEAERYTTDQLIEILNTQGDRLEPYEETMSYLDGLKEDTGYTLCALGYTAENKCGQLVKDNVRTKVRTSNVMAPVESLKINVLKYLWEWDITMGEGALYYYQWLFVGKHEDARYFEYPDVVLAWYLKNEELVNNPPTPIFDKEGFYTTTFNRQQEVLQIITWAADHAAVLSSEICNIPVDVKKFYDGDQSVRASRYSNGGALKIQSVSIPELEDKYMFIPVK